MRTEKKQEKREKSLETYLRILACIFLSGLTFFAYIDKQNQLTELRRKLPSLAKELKSIQEENNRLKYEIETFESPIHLMELLRKPEFSHLRFPYTKDIIILPSMEKESKNE